MTERRQDALWAVGLSLVALVLYRAAFVAGFLNWDDDRFVTENPLFHGDLGSYVRAALTEVQMDAYHPLHLLAYLPDKLFWPDAPIGFHLVNVALFAVDACLLHRLARRVAPPLAAGLAALLFVVHPLCVEPVMWISARKDLLALMFFVLALLREDRAPGPRPSLPGLGWFACAVLTKTSAVCFPVVLVAWLVFLRGVPLRAALSRALPHVGVALVAGAVTIVVWRSHEMILVQRPVSVWLDVPATLGLYAARVVAPVSLSPIYPAVSSWTSWLAAGVALAAVAVALAYRRIPVGARFALVAFVAALGPVSNLVPIYFRFADRYAFIALAVLVPPLAMLLARAGRRAVLVAPVVGVLAFVTLAGSRAWVDSVSLFERAVAARPDALFARLKLGETRRAGKAWPAAVEQYQAAIRLAPENPLGYAGLFYTYAERAEAAGAIPPGTARGWLAALGRAVVEPPAFERLVADVSSRSCAPCESTLVLLGLRRYPRSDAQLVDAARQALASDRPELALVYLSFVKNPDTAGRSEVEQAASARVRTVRPR